MSGTALLAGCPGNAIDTDVDGETSTSRRDDNSQQQTGTREMREYPSPETWEHANDRQRQRAVRSFDQLKKRNVPVYHGPFLVDDDEAVTLQSPQDVARRTLVLWAVVLRADGTPQKEALELIEQLDLWDSVSPEEKHFLQDDDPDPDDRKELVWRFESIWVLLWALGYVEELDWPSSMCDVSKLVDILKPHESSPEFITGAKLRSKAEILDAQDLIKRTHWAISDALLHQDGMVPADLDWSQDDDWIPVTMSAAYGVVLQRHYTLNWLAKLFNGPKDWDNVDTST